MPQPPSLKPHERYTHECRQDLAAARELLARVKAGGARSIAATLEPYNDALIHLSNAAARSELMFEVHPDADMRAAAEACTKEAARVDQDRLLDRDLYEAIAAVHLDGSDADTHRFVERTLRDFRRAGVDKDDATRARLKELLDQMVADGLEFDKNIREDVRRVKLDPKDLDGLPADYIAAHAPGPDGKVEITTDYPDYLPFRSYARSTAARRQLYVQYQTRGYPQNDDAFRRLLGARRELARLLGYASWADYITEDKMIKSSRSAQDFIDRIAKLADKRAHADYAALLARKKQDDKHATEVFDYERAYYEELVKKEHYDFDAQSVRPYFEFNRTRDGLLAITSKLFDVEYRKVVDADVWHPDVDVYDVYQKGAKLGRIFLDLHPRENKYKHAAQFSYRPGVAGKQLPEGTLVCNFPDPRTSKGPALMDHDDVVTMFHEFGHLMHHVLAGHQRWVYFSGVATEQDFVEAPSQMLEEWAWDPSTLALFARHVDTNEPIPGALVKRMRGASEFGKGVFARTQMFYAALSLAYHEADPAELDFTKSLVELQHKYSMFGYVEGTHFYDSFGHLNGYSAMYYTYMWSLVIAKDLLSEFQKHGLLDEDTAHRYRDRVLVPGGSKDAADLVKDFLGRPYSFESYQRWLEQG
jgi:thimet oligopeptidase